jgi:hypothetical protein
LNFSPFAAFHNFRSLWARQLHEAIQKKVKKIVILERFYRDIGNPAPFFYDKDNGCLPQGSEIYDPPETRRRDKFITNRLTKTIFCLG